ncbi:DgyrCDS4397 [Dimorphilus gyrociliatus]|uniref:DgyrCDS4397 n=1 Tax=Dimorphilus gyrociliatus TaxID=2664684 RepID=A0A7I8VGJ5_9ANNE|nr:DgyrCDS4397 [Dimorphilus gyrociliatus]
MGSTNCSEKELFPAIHSKNNKLNLSYNLAGFKHMSKQSSSGHQRTETDTFSQQVELQPLRTGVDTVVRYQQDNRNSMGDSKKCLILTVSVLVAIGSILILILVPLSFSGVEYYEFAFKKRKSTGSIYREKAYDVGKYHLGPDFSFLKFPAYAQHESLHVTIFDSGKTEITIQARFQYFLRKDLLKYLHGKFGMGYKPIVRKNAINALKNTATNFALRQFILERSIVEKELFQRIKTILGGECCAPDCKENCKCIPYKKCTEDDFGTFVDVRFFQLLSVKPPPGRQVKKLSSLVLPEQTEVEIIKHDAKQIRLETEKEVNEIENSANEIKMNATADADYLKAKAQAEAAAMIEKARYDGLKKFYDTVGLSDAKQKIAFDYLRSVQKSGNTRLKVNFDKMVAILNDK